MDDIDYDEEGMPVVKSTKRHQAHQGGRRHTMAALPPSGAVHGKPPPATSENLAKSSRSNRSHGGVRARASISGQGDVAAGEDGRRGGSARRASLSSVGGGMSASGGRGLGGSRRSSLSGGSMNGGGGGVGNVLSGIFDIDGKTCDVVLNQEAISWTPLSSAAKPRSKKNRNFFKRLKSANNMARELGEEHVASDAMYNIPLKTVAGASIRRNKTASGEHYQGGERVGACEGVTIYTYDHKTANRYKERKIFLPHPNDDVCHNWVNSIHTHLKAFSERPKRVRVYLQPYAGKKLGRGAYRKHVQPLLEAAGIHTDLVELMHNEEIKQDVSHLEVSNYDCLVVVGGDGSVHRLVNAVLDLSQKLENVEVRQNFCPTRAALPIGIIPTGTVNQIAHSVQGVDDVETATMHIILGNTQSVDVCSVFNSQDDAFHSWTLLSHYGFFGSFASFLPRYTKMGENRLVAASMKALTKAKFKAYDCEMQYILAPNANGHPGDKRVCCKRCVHCHGYAPEDDTGGEDTKFTDDVIELDPLNMSSASSTMMEVAEEAESLYKTFKGSLLSLSLLAIPGHCEMAPFGMNKFTHLNDGCMDAIIVRDVPRKEFTRYLRRHGNQKDQGDLPFVERLRCKEIKVHLRMDLTWKHHDYSYNEINYEMERQNKMAAKPDENMEVINDLADSSADDSNVDSDNDDSESYDYSNHTRRSTGVRSGSVSMGGSSGTSSAQASRNNSRSNSVLDISRDGAYRSATYRPTWLENEKARRAKQERKRHERKRDKDQQKMKSVWNMDNELYEDLNLHFRAHRGLLTIYGEGVTPEYRPDEVEARFPCLALM